MIRDGLGGHVGNNSLFDSGAIGRGPAVLSRGGGFMPQRFDLARLDLSRFALPGIDELDLRFDLGHRIGSRQWWLGAATVATLCGAALLAGLHVTPIPLPARMPLTAIQNGEVAADAIAPLALGAATGRHVLPNRDLVERLAEAPERPRIEMTAHVGAADGFEAALRRSGVGPDDIKTVTALTGAAANIRNLKPGTALDLVLGRRETKAVPRPLTSLGFRAAFDLRLELARGEDGALVLKRIPIAIDDTPLRVSGLVGSSLARAAHAAGVPAAVVADYIQQMSYAIDFQRQVGARDRFDIIVEHRRAATGETETGGLLYAGLAPRKGERIDLLRWSFGGKAQFFRGNGESAKKGLMRTPVDGAHLTSNFGMRFHPILNYSRLHQGVDFGATYGSPVFAAAGGRISFAGTHGGHGNYIMLVHRPGLATAYAHLSGFRVKVGQQVAQGQIIGYVGSTGLSTGPHLHYEVWLNNQPVNPLGIKFVGGTQLGGVELTRFKAALDRLRGLKIAGGGTSDDAQVADAGVPAKKKRG